MAGMFDDIINNVGEPYKGGKGFEYGTHEVMIGSATAVEKSVQKNPKAAVIELEVFDPADENKVGNATLYFHTDKGAQMSVAKVLGIMIHNVGEEKKDRVREIGKKLFAEVNNATEARDVAAKLLNDKFVGKYKAFFVVEPQGKYKTSAYGDIWHYPAEPQSDPVTDTPTESSVDVSQAPGVDPADIPEFDDL